MIFERFKQLQPVYIPFYNIFVNLNEIGKFLKAREEQNPKPLYIIQDIINTLRRHQNNIKQMTSEMHDAIEVKIKQCEEQIETSVAYHKFNQALQLVKDKFEKSSSLYEEGNYYEYGEELVAIHDTLSSITKRLENTQNIICNSSRCVTLEKSLPIETNVPSLRGNCFFERLNNESNTEVPMGADCLQFGTNHTQSYPPSFFSLAAKTIPPIAALLLSTNEHSPAYNSYSHYQKPQVSTCLLIPLALTSLALALLLLLIVYKACCPKDSNEESKSRECKLVP